MKDQSGNEITENTKLGELPKEALNNLLGSLTLGQTWLLKALQDAKLGQAPEGWQKWCLRFSRMGVNVQPPHAVVGTTTYLQLGASIGLNADATRNLLDAFGITDVADLSTPVSLENLNKLGLPEQNQSCFVATTVFGSANAPEVMRLRRWRDTSLARHRPGRLFVTVYYWIGPYLAALVKNRPVAVNVIRRWLRRFVKRLD